MARDTDTFRILVSTDNHVGYNERDPVRGDDSWKTFHEVMCLAKERQVDFVLLAGDLFHDNKPSRQAMVQVMRSLRMNCLGDKPCEFDMIGDQSEVFSGVFDHVNYYDPDINVAIPVFSIHGNHDDPSGEGHFAALDVLSTAGLVNYYGRTPEANKIAVKPVLLQKGRTKLALYGLSNVRDERLHRTFRDGNVTFYRPNIAQDEWFNLLSVHQNRPRRGHTDTNHLPENFLPSFVDLVIWGHEHECIIDPQKSQTMPFYVMQPGSSVATSLVEGEAVLKQVSLLTITGKTFKSEPITLKTVRPFVYQDIKLASEPGMERIMKKTDNKDDVRRHLRKKVDEMIEEANRQWLESQTDSADDATPPLPIIRLRVDYTAPEGGHFDIENPQRFSSHFNQRVANTSDVVSFIRKKTVLRKVGDSELEQPEESTIAQLSLDSVRVEKLVKEFLAAQSLTILPQNSFGAAVNMFVDKDDKNAVEQFVSTSLSNQVKHLLSFEDEGEIDQQDLLSAIETFRAAQEQGFESGKLKNKRTKQRLKPKPDTWDSDLDGSWEDQPGARIYSDDEEAADAKEASRASSVQPARGSSHRGRAGRGTARSKQAGSSRASTRAQAKPTRATRGQATIEISSDDEAQEEDVAMLDDDFEDAPEEPSEPTPPPPPPKPRATTRSQPAKKAAPKASLQKPSTRQTQLSFSQASTRPTQQAAPTSSRRKNQVSDDEISDDDDDDFESAPSSRLRRR